MDITRYQPCWKGLAWYKTQPDFATAWNNCEEPGWMEWLMDKLGVLDLRDNIRRRELVYKTTTILLRNAGHHLVEQGSKLDLKIKRTIARMYRELYTDKVMAKVMAKEKELELSYAIG